MKAPKGFNYSSPFWQLWKGLYGLRQAGRQWYLTLHAAYSDLGYSYCETDWSVYMWHNSSSLSMSATSVDNILLVSDSKAESDLATSEINNKFIITDSGDADWILGCRITCCQAKCLLMIDQLQFILNILHKFGIKHSKPNIMPCPKWRLSVNMCPKTNDECQAVKSLPYCAIIRKCRLRTCSLHVKLQAVPF